METKRTKIVCTMGPTTEDDDVLRRMMLEGMNVARFNFSHGSHDYHRTNIERVRRIADELGKTIALLADTKGPEIRTGLTTDHEPVFLEPGSLVTVCTKPVDATSERFSISYEALPREVRPGDVIFVDDGLMCLRVESSTDDEITCTVLNGGFLEERKGVNVPSVITSLPNVTEQDADDIRFACEMGMDLIAASFIRNPETVYEIRDLCARFGKPRMQVFSKIESAQALGRLDEIIAASDGIMVARGDLGVEVPPASLPNLQKEIIGTCNRAFKPVITATQMLESMRHAPRPTRAEVTDVANAIYDGTDCVMLSGETAAGKYPVESVAMMAEICRQTEEHLTERHEFYHDDTPNTGEVTGFAAVQAAEYMHAKALLCPTMTGRTARIMSSFRPDLPILAASPFAETIRLTSLYWGVTGIYVDEQESVTKTFHAGMQEGKRLGLLKRDDIVVTTAGDPVTSPLSPDASVTSSIDTNVMMIAQVL